MIKAGMGKWLEPRPSSILYYKGIKLSKDQYKALCKINFDNFRHVPKKHIDKEMVDIAIDAYASNIQYVPKKFLTLEVCKKAYKKDRYCNDLMPPEMYLEIINGEKKII